MMLPILPLLFLITALGSVVLYLRTAHDIFGVLAVVSSLVCLIWGLVIAHWSVHLLALLGLLLLRSPFGWMNMTSNRNRAA
jgi:hypothetical protein